MNIEIIPASSVPPALLESRGLRSSEWDVVADKLLDAKRGDWLRIPLDQLPGKALKNKQGNISTAMRIRKLAVTTRSLGKHLWISVKPEPSKSK